MRNRRQKPIYFVILVLLSVGLAGSRAAAAPEQAREEKDIGGEKWAGETAEPDSVEWTGGIARAEGATEAPEAVEQAAFPEQGVRQKASRQSEPEKMHTEKEGQSAGEAEQLPSPASMLAVTDLRINTPEVKEYANREAFLCEYDFDGQEPYFEYYTEDGALQLELYYDEYSGVGCGLRYYPGEDWEPEGFLFNGACNYRYYTDFMESGGIETDRYSISSFDGTDGTEDVEDYEESAVYREDGRPEHYTSQGWITYLTEKKEISKIMEIDWSYREDGTLRERDYWHNGMVFGTWYSSRQSYYDEKERLVYEHCYVTHGSVDYYYIYEDESEIPAYCLIIDYNTGMLCAELLEYHGTGAEVQGTGVMVQGAETERQGTEVKIQGTGTKVQDAETVMYYGRVGPMLAGESENRYAAAVIEAAVKEGEDCDGYITHTYAADYDGDSLEEAFVIYGKEIKDEYEPAVHLSGWDHVSGDLLFHRFSLGGGNVHCAG